MKRLFLILVMGICCLYTYGQSKTYRILAKSSSHVGNKVASTSEFEKDSGYVVVDDEKVMFYDSKWHRLASVNCKSSSKEIQGDVVYLKSRGSMGKEAVTFVLLSKDEITDDNPDVMRMTFNNNQKSFSYLLGSL